MLEFDFSKFAESLSKDFELVSTTYYIGKIKTNKSKVSLKMQANQQKLFAHLKTQKIFYSLGYLLKSGGKYHEKGVDVNIAVDMLVCAYENTADKIILVSSDTDLLPAILKAKEKGKSIEYIGFSHQPSLAMIANCTNSQLLTKNQLEPFLTKKSRKQH